MLAYVFQCLCLCVVPPVKCRGNLVVQESVPYPHECRGALSVAPKGSPPSPTPMSNGHAATRTVRSTTTHVAMSSGWSRGKGTPTGSGIEEELRDNVHFLELQLVNLRDENAKLKQAYHHKLEELNGALKV